MVELSAGSIGESEPGFEPLALASGGWSSHMINGPAICVVLARALEKDYDAEGFIPARLTVDLFSRRCSDR